MEERKKGDRESWRRKKENEEGMKGGKKEIPPM